MHTKTLILIIVIGLLSSLASSQNQTVDYFPLSVGNSWSYNYYSSDNEQLAGYFVSDSGIATYKIISKTVTVDSTVWQVQEIRNIKHRYRNNTPPPFIDTLYTVIDSSMFWIIEYMNGNHRLVSTSNWSSVFSFRDVFTDTNSFYRYHQSQPADTFTISLYHYSNPSNVLQIYQASLKQKIGLTKVVYTAPGFTGWIPKTNHSLVNSIIVSVDQHITNSTPNRFTIQQNYPNPFNPLTTIKIDNPSQSNVKISIYDAVGRLLETILDREVLPGQLTIHWDGGGYSSGVYFCVANSGGLTKSIKLVLQK